MSDEKDYTSDIKLLKQIAAEVRRYSVEIENLQQQYEKCLARAESLPVRRNEEGDDVNAAARADAYSAADSVQNQLRKVQQELSLLKRKANELAEEYQSIASTYQKKAASSGEAADKFSKVSTKKYGAKAASKSEKQTLNRKSYYQTLARNAEKLAEAARNAAQGQDISLETLEALGDKGTFESAKGAERKESVDDIIAQALAKDASNPHREQETSEGSGHLSSDAMVLEGISKTICTGSAGERTSDEPTGKPGDFSAYQTPYKGPVASVQLDAEYALRHQMTGEAVRDYRKSRGLVWARDTVSGLYYLLPAIAAVQYGLTPEDDHLCYDPRHQLNAYMNAHAQKGNKRRVLRPAQGDYRSDPEWKRLHDRASSEASQPVETPQGRHGTSSQGIGGSSEEGKRINKLRSLVHTDQVTAKLYLNGRLCKVFDHPFEDNIQRICNQGSAYPTGPQDTCGCCSGGSIVNKAGGKATEHRMVALAWNNGLCDNDGFMTADAVSRLLGLAGVPASSTSGTSLNDLAESVEQGHGVIIAVNAKRFDPTFYRRSGGHALVLESVVRDADTNEILEYVVVDSNRDTSVNAVRRVEPQVLERAFRDWGNQSISTDNIIW